MRFAVAGSYCSVCKTSLISDEAGVYGVCAACVPGQAEKARAWRQFMQERFRPHRPLEGEVFEVRLILDRCSDGQWLACREIGSNMVEPQLCDGRKFPTQEEGERFLSELGIL